MAVLSPCLSQRESVREEVACGVEGFLPEPFKLLLGNVGHTMDLLRLCPTKLD